MWLVTKQNGASRLEALGNTQNRADIKLAKSYLLGEKAIPKIKMIYIELMKASRIKPLAFI